MLKTGRRPPAARESQRRHDDDRPQHLAATLPSHPRSRPVSRPVRPHAREAPHLYGTGPRYSKLGGRVVYRLDDLQAWVDRGSKVSTSDDTGEEVLPAKRHAAVSPAYAGQARR